MEVKIILVGVAKEYKTNQYSLLKDKSYNWYEHTVDCNQSMEFNVKNVVKFLELDPDFVKPVLLDVQTKKVYTDDCVLNLYYGLVLPPDLKEIKNYSLLDADSISFAVTDEDWVLIGKVAHIGILP